MSLLHILKLAIQLPKKQALFQLNRISMRDTLVYLFLLFFIAFLPNAFINVQQFDYAEQVVSYSQYLLQVIVTYPFLIMFFVVSGVSILALPAWFLSIGLNRKLAYQQLWKMTGFALLFPIISYLILFYSPISNYIAASISGLLLYSLLCKMILIYPKRKKRSVHH
ncbi:hypothetical protein ACFOZ1_02785 [Gracilibacillus marinus]|uniref:DUF1189 domain-containing protein n=1 Tax=Gracilibacillus marinus TaxID=630535 RepID=A0ABV8VVA0_9BACI